MIKLLYAALSMAVIYAIYMLIMYFIASPKPKTDDSGLKTAPYGTK